MRARARNQPKSSLICAGCRLPSATAATATASFLTSSAPSRRQLAPASCSQPNWPIHFGAAARSWRARASSWSSSFVKSMAPGHINFCQPGGGRGGAKLITAGTPSGSPGRRRRAGSTRPSADLSKWPLTAPLSQSRPSRLDSRRPLEATWPRATQIKPQNDVEAKMALDGPPIGAPPGRPARGSSTWKRRLAGPSCPSGGGRRRRRTTTRSREHTQQPRPRLMEFLLRRASERPPDKPSGRKHKLSRAGSPPSQFSRRRRAGRALAKTRICMAEEQRGRARGRMPREARLPLPGRCRCRCCRCRFLLVFALLFLLLLLLGWR